MEEERQRAADALLRATQSERERAEAEMQARQQQMLSEHMRSQALLEAEKERVSAAAVVVTMWTALQARQQMEEEAVAKNSIIKQLEDEKRKIEADVASLKVRCCCVLLQMTHAQDVSLRRKQAREELLNLTTSSPSKVGD